MKRTGRLTRAYGGHGKKTSSGELHVVGRWRGRRGYYKCCVVLYGMLMWMDVEKRRRQRRRRENRFVDGGSKCWLPRKQQVLVRKKWQYLT
jgi:hypothetical protein